MEKSRRSDIACLKKYGRDLTEEARLGKLLPVVGRDAEIDRMMDVLCRHTKRNPALVGPAGVGKTAIVEGFARRIVEKRVPSIFANATVILLQPSLILAGGIADGELERRVRDLLRAAARKDIVVFIDEIHSIVGAGGDQGRCDIASLMKPALARGEIACIGATTDDEYRRFIEHDSALERRFHKIPVNEMGANLVTDVLAVHRDDLRERYRVDVDDKVLRKLIWYGQKYLRNRTFPDKAVDLLEQCIASAVKRQVQFVDTTDADRIVRDVIGMPVNMDERLNCLRSGLEDRFLLSSVESERLLGRLRLTMRGLDVRMERPNASLLLLGDAASNASLLAETISNALFDSIDRIVTIDLGRIMKPEDITLLLGAPPGYVGFSQSVPLHRVMQTPWCVVLFKNVDSCHLTAQQVIGQALVDGYFLDGQNRKIYLSDAIVIFTAPSVRSAGSIGFLSEPDGDGKLKSRAKRRLDDSIVSAQDLICSAAMACDTAHGRQRRIVASLLEGLADHYSICGVNLAWDESFTSLLEERCVVRMTAAEWERMVDEEISPKVLQCMEGSGGEETGVVIRGGGYGLEVENISLK